MNSISNKPFSTFHLKLIACITMLIDHSGLCYYYIASANHCLNMPFYLALRSIGRLAFPIFCFLLIQGFFHTKKLSRYILRLSLFAILSELPFNYMVSKNIFSLQYCSVYATLLLGLLCVAFIDYSIKKASSNSETMLSKHNIPILLSCLLVIAITITLSHFIHCDYSICGILLILSFYFFRNNFTALFISTTMNFLLFSSPLELFGLLAFALIFNYNNKKGYSDNKLIQFGFYLFYPIHIAFLDLLISLFS